MSDLGGLGAKEGPPTTYSYTPASIGPRVLPWAAMLLLLVFKPNRTRQAWWIWLPLMCLAAIEHALVPQFNFLPSVVMDIYCGTFSSLAFGIAAVFLLASYLQNRLRFLAFLKTLVATIGFSAVAFLVRQDWGEGAIAFAFVIFLGVGALVLVSALSLAGRVCRRGYQPSRLLLWLFVFICAGWLVVTGPFAIIAIASGGGGGSWLEFLTIVLAMAVITFVTVLPFMILASANAFFRERLKALLHLERAVPPPIIAPQPTPSVAS